MNQEEVGHLIEDRKVTTEEAEEEETGLKAEEGQAVGDLEGHILEL